MYDTLLVYMIDSQEDLVHDLARLHLVDRANLLKPVEELLPIDERHDDVDVLFVLKALCVLCNVRVVKLCEHGDLLLHL